MARSGCYYCPKNMAYQCDLDFGRDGRPPCAKTDVENVNSIQQLKAETLRCTECEHTYDGSSPTPVTWSRYCYSCLWFPKKPVLTDNFIQRKASAI